MSSCPQTQSKAPVCRQSSIGGQKPRACRIFLVFQLPLECLHRLAPLSPLRGEGLGVRGKEWSLTQLPTPASVLSLAPQCLGKPALARAARQNRRSAPRGSPPSPAPHREPDRAPCLPR